ncbi:MAG: glycopeptide resistance accessory protein VanW [Oscillospiraceae bacterium]|nr:glycopeptide resistance accessory protein VanW [Oscillospiraceae bacterium]
MQRRRLTQLFPFLLPVRKWQRKKLFYLKMRIDKNKYAKKISNNLLPCTVFETSSLMVNQNSGYDIKFQLNKVHNLKLAAKKLDKLVIEPNETFSFCKSVRFADRYEPYLDGLCLVDGKIAGSYAGGLCQLSNMLFWLFLHTPLTVTERHGHAVEFFPSATEDLPCGTDATINEGWLDLKVLNETDNTFQIEIRFDSEYMYGRILSQKPADTDYTIYNSSVSYIRKNGRIYQLASVCRSETDKNTYEKTEKELYRNKCEIAYKLPESIHIEESGD